MTGPHRGVGIEHGRRLQRRTQRRQDRGTFVVFQALFLDLQPSPWVVGRTTLGRLGEIITDMETVHRVRALGAEARRDLIGDPERAIAESMDLAVGAQARRDGASQQLPSGNLDTTVQGRTVDPCRAAVGVRQTQLGLRPQQPLPAPTVRAVRRKLTGTATLPARIEPYRATSISVRLGRQTATRSPRRSPSSIRPAAAASVASATRAYESVPVRSANAGEPCHAAAVASSISWRRSNQRALLPDDSHDCTRTNAASSRPWATNRYTWALILACGRLGMSRDVPQTRKVGRLAVSNYHLLFERRGTYDKSVRLFALARLDRDHAGHGGNPDCLFRR